MFIGLLQISNNAVIPTGAKRSGGIYHLTIPTNHQILRLALLAQDDGLFFKQPVKSEFSGYSVAVGWGWVTSGAGCGVVWGILKPRITPLAPVSVTSPPMTWSL